MIEIKVDGIALRDVISQLKKHMSGEAIHKAVGHRLLKWINDNFKSEGKLISSGGWQSLKEETIKRRRKNSATILQDTGRLRQSFDIFGIASTARSVTVGTNDVRAATHQFGLGKIPARPMLPDGTRAASIVRPMLEEALKQAIKNARN